MDRAEYRRILTAVDRILLEDWDPIGVSDEPAAHDEYSTYAPDVIRLLLDGAGARRIGAYLADIESTQMGLRGNAERRQSAAEKLSHVDVTGLRSTGRLD